MNCISLYFVIFSLGFASCIPALNFHFVIKKDTTHHIKLGDKAIIDCNTDNQNARITLWKLGKASPGAIVSGSNVIVDDGDFIFKNTLSEDAGSYKCEATDGYGNKINRNVLIKIDTSQNALAMKPAAHHISVFAGNHFKLVCEATGHYYALNWKFIHMQQKPSRQDYTIITHQVNKIGKSVLIVNNAKREYSGYYQCQVTRSAIVRRTIKEVYVQVIVPKRPTFKNPNHETKSVKNSQGLNRNPVFLDCELASGSPTPTILWKKDGITLKTCTKVFTHTCYGSRYITTKGGLQIKAANYALDNGDFSCVATNAAGTSVKTTTVVVQVAPDLSKSQPGVLTSRKGTHNITCRDTQGNPPPVFTWLLRLVHGNYKSPWQDLTKIPLHKIHSKDKMSSTVTIPSYITAAEYRCKAVNVAGSETHDIQFIRI